VFYRRLPFLTSLALFVALLPFTSPASVIILHQDSSDIAALGAVSETINTTGTYASYHGRTVAGVTNVDQKDATFRLLVDFNNFDSGGSDNQVLWESGGRTVGSSLVYSTGNVLTLRTVSSGGNVLQTLSNTLTTAQIIAGDIELLWTMDIDPTGSGGTGINFWIDRGPLSGLSFDSSSESDWTGSGGAGFGVPNGRVPAGGGNTGLPNTGSFTGTSSGTINTTTGLQYWANTTVRVVPEPTTLLSLSITAIGLMLGHRQRRSLPLLAN